MKQNSIVINAKENDIVFTIFEKDGAIDEIHINVDGEKVWTVIGYNDLIEAIKLAEKAFKVT